MDDYRYDSYVAAQINTCSTDYCPRCHCDFGGGDCFRCRAAEAIGLRCSYCGKRMPRNGALRECHGEPDVNTPRRTAL